MAKFKRSFPGWLVLPAVLFAMLLPGAWISAQSRKGRQEGDPKSQTIFRLPVDIVVVNATVTDKAGNPVTDLTASDFRVYDDGKPQPIQTFALETYGPEEETAEVGDRSSHPASKKTAGEQTAPRARLISIVIDDLTMKNAADFNYMMEGVKTFVQKDMSAGDMVAVVSGSGNVQLPFTDDKQQLLEQLPVALRKLNFATINRSTCPRLSDLQAWRISDALSDFRVNYQPLIQETLSCLGLSDTPGSDGTAMSFLKAAARQQNQISEFQTRNLLYTVRQHIRALRHFDGEKAVVVFSDGFLAEPSSPASYQLQDLIDLALRSGIILNTINIRGLEGEISVVPTDGPADPEDKLAQESPLSQMAYETGGLFFHNDNNLRKGLRSAIRRQSYYYILSYGMPSPKADGAYHKIKLEVTRPGLSLSYRKGYFTQKEELRYENSKKEDLIDALNAPGNMNEIPMTLAYNYSVEDDSTYAVSFVTNVNIRGMQFPEEEGRRKNMVSLVLVALDENDHFISGLEKMVDFRLLESSYASLRDHGLVSRVELKLPMGNYKIKAVVRESTQGKMGSITKAVEIP